MAWVFGQHRTNFTHSKESLMLPMLNGSKVSLPDLVKSATPPCRLNPLLFNGHLQTAWTAMKDEGPPIYYKRTIFEAEDSSYSGIFAVDFVVAKYEGSDPTLPPRTTMYEDSEFDGLGSMDSKPMIVTLHGLSGGSYEVYLRSILEPLVTKEAGWEACVVNSRGCAMSKITSSVLYNARATWDMRQTVKWLRRKFPNRPLFGLGFSLGANILTNYIAEEGANCELKAAVVCSSPWNLEAGSLALQRTWLGLEVYSKTMGTNMKKLFEQHAEQISKNPRIDVEKIRNITYLHDFDREVQGPTWGYPTETAYYRDASSSDSLFAVRIPLLAINAEDDPIAVNEALPYREVQQTPFPVLLTTSVGGHLGWFETGGTRWLAKPAGNFLNKMAKEVDLEKMTETIKESAVHGDAAMKLNNPNFDPMRRKLVVQK